MWSSIKSALLRRGDASVLPWLFCEKEVLGDVASFINLNGRDPQFDDDVWDDMKTARARSNVLAAEDHSAAAIKSVLTKKQQDLIAIDKTFAVDVKFWMQLLGPKSGALLYSKVDALMPTQAGPQIEKSALAQQLHIVLQSGLAKFCNAAVSTEITELHKAVVGISAGKAPKLRANATEVPKC